MAPRSTQSLTLRLPLPQVELHFFLSVEFSFMDQWIDVLLAYPHSSKILTIQHLESLLCALTFYPSVSPGWTRKSIDLRVPIDSSTSGLESYMCGMLV